MVSTLAIQNLTDSTLVHGFVTTDCDRRTIDILWSCLTAIFISIWTVIHLPVPCFDIERPDNFRRKVVRSRVGASLMALLAPEFMLFIAIGEIAGAYIARKKLRKLSIDANLTHGFFLQMGGFCLRAPGGRCHQLVDEDIENAITASKTAGETRNTITASDTVTETEDVIASDHSVKIKDALLHSEEWVRELQLIKESDIEDLAKSNSIEKLLASFQGLWVLTQAISRIHQHKALSLLEVTTSAYICCAVAIYALWWKKPQNCSVPIMITCSDEAIDELSSSAYGEDIESWWEFVWAGRSFNPIEQTGSYSFSTSTRYCMTGLSAFSLMVFGSVHLASWNSRLPSTIELWMWRGSSLHCVIYAGLIAFYVYWDGFHDSGALNDILENLAVYGVFVYFIARIYMIVEVFISVRALPASAFQTVQWSSFLPHI